MELLDELEAALTSFNPPPFLSPRTLRPKYESIISAAQELLIKAESGEGEDIPDEDIPALKLEEDIPPKRVPAEKETPENRVQEILSCIRDASITLDEFCRILRVDKMPKHERREQDFLIRLIRGYQPVSVGDIRKALPLETRPSSNIWSKACERLTEARFQPDRISRLSLIDLQLVHLVESAPFTRLIDHALYTAARLQFALDYNRLSAGDRAEYPDKAFKTCKERDIKDLGNDRAAIAGLKLKFKTSHRKAVTGRGHLLKLYKLFGVSIFLDPSLEARTRGGAPAVSDSYAATIQILEQRLVPFSGMLDKLDDQNRIFLFNFLRAAGTPSVYNFVKRFVESFDGN